MLSEHSISYTQKRKSVLQVPVYTVERVKKDSGKNGPKVDALYTVKLSDL